MVDDGSIVTDRFGNEVSSISELPRPMNFSSTTFIYGNGYSDTEPLPTNLAIEKVEAYYSEQ